MNGDGARGTRKEEAAELLRGARECVAEARSALRSPDLETAPVLHSLLETAVTRLHNFLSAVAVDAHAGDRELLAAALELQREVSRLRFLFGSFAGFCAGQLCVLGATGSGYSSQGGVTAGRPELRLLAEG